jgi:hypothetical protein
LANSLNLRGAKTFRTKVFEKCLIPNMFCDIIKPKVGNAPELFVLSFPKLYGFVGLFVSPITALYFPYDLSYLYHTTWCEETL